MKRKMMAAVLIMAMTAGVLGGCGNSTGNNAKTDTNAQNNANTAEIKENANADVTEIANADGTVYKVGIVQYVDDASLNQIEKAIEAELDAKGAELGVTFDYADYTYNGQADSSTLNQIATDLVAEKVDVIIPIATPAARTSSINSQTSSTVSPKPTIIPVLATTPCAAIRASTERLTSYFAALRTSGLIRRTVSILWDIISGAAATTLSTSSNRP